MTDSESSNNSASTELRDADWERLGDIVERFSDAWEQAPPLPEIKDYVDDLASGPLRHFALVELIKFELELRSNDPEAWLPLEHYRNDWPELCVDGNMPADLVYEEIQIRRRHFGDVDTHVKQCAAVFPGGIKALTRLLATDPYKSTSVLRSKRVKQFEPGQTIDDFDLLIKLGAGAFGTVFLARQNSMQRLVALKIAADEGFEPQTLAQLDHPHIVRVYDQRTINELGVNLMYMQYIAGATLDEIHDRVLQKNEDDNRKVDGHSLVLAIDDFLVQRGESIPVQSINRSRLKEFNWPRVICSVGQQIASALHYAHQKNVLHRDLKPANVLLDGDCNAKLVDFNVSFCSKLEGVTPASYFGGSLGYMSPEQLEACSPWHDREPDDLTGKSDVYALGMLLFELLTGERPYSDTQETADMNHVLNDMIEKRKSGPREDESAKLANQPRLLCRLINRTLEGDPDNRPDANGVARYLGWAGYPGADRYFFYNSWIGKQAERWSIATVCLLTLGISAAAALFITTYNLMESVPPDSQDFFQSALRAVNGITFGIGGFIIVWLMLPIARVLKRIRLGIKTDSTELEFAIKCNWKIGHFVAVMCIVEWSLAGFIYPTVLSVADVPLTKTGWFDFISSHLIAGLIAGAYTFWSVTYFAMKHWHPRLMLASLESESEVESSKEIETLQRRCSIHQVVALAMPLLGIAWLIWWGRAENQYALGFVTLVALLGLGFLVWAMREVQHLLITIRSLDDDGQRVI